MNGKRRLVWLALALAMAGKPASGAQRVAVFRADATSALGEPNIWVQPVIEVLDPLWVKGIVMEAKGGRAVLAAIDWCGVGGPVDLMLRARMARAAGTTVERVALQSVHQHTAPYVEGGGYEMLARHGVAALRMSAGYLETLAVKMEAAVREAAGRLEAFDQVGTGLAAVERVASARRILKDGKVLVRYSSTAKTPELAEEPEGAIDPDLRTVTFARGAKAIVRLHYYATHPQTFCCDGRVTADFAGAARERMEAEEGVPQIYFNGCGGDVTVGKYNRGSESDREGLAVRLLAGMRASIGATRYRPAGRARWRSLPFRLPARTDAPAFAGEKDAATAYRLSIKATFAARERPLPASVLDLGETVILHLPGEPFLEFQRYAQGLGRGRFVAVAGYGDIGPGYLCTDAAYEQGGYEPTATNVRPGSEAILKQVIRRLLR